MLMSNAAEKRKILMVAYNGLGAGGIQNVIMNVVRNLSDEFAFDVVCFDSERTNYDEFKSYGGQIFRAERRKYNYNLARKLDYYIRGKWIEDEIKSIITNNGPYAAIHSHKEAENGLILFTAKHCGVPVRIAHAHTAFDRKLNPIAKAYTGYLKKLIRSNATHMVACSQKAGEKLFGENGFSVIYNTVDRRFFDCSLDHAEHEAPHLIQVGLICENKNQLFSLSVLRCLKAAYADAKLTCIGAPRDAGMERYLSGLMEKTAKFGLTGSVTFLPPDSDVKEEMEKADYLIFPSHFEGLGIVPIEAQALGMKCFVSTGVPAEANCGGNVYLSLDAGAEAWAKRIMEQFEADHGARQQYDMSRFSPDVIMEQYRKLYRGELN